MGKLVAGTFMSLDGVMQAPGGPEEDPSDGFAHGGWTVEFWDEEMGGAVDEVFARAEALLVGRKTYEIFAGYWPLVTDPENHIAAKLNSMPKHVASRSLDRADWQGTTVLADVPREVAALKARVAGDILIQGSSDLIQTLLSHDLIDEFHLWVFPVVLGPGKRLFGRGTVPRRLQLVESRTSSTGVVLLTYRPAGEVPHGTFALEDGREVQKP